MFVFADPGTSRKLPNASVEPGRFLHAIDTLYSTVLTYKLEQMLNTRLFPSVSLCKPLLLIKLYLENTWSLGKTQHAISPACHWPDQLDSPEEKSDYGAVKPSQAATPSREK